MVGFDVGGGVVGLLVGGGVVGFDVGFVVPPVHVTPLSVKDVGTGLLPDHDALKPTCAVAPVDSEPFQPALLIVTAAPDCVAVPPQACVICWPAPNDQPSFQLLTASPRLVTTTSPPKPLGHWLVTLYSTLQPVAACAGTARSAPTPAIATSAAEVNAAVAVRRRVVSRMGGPLLVRRPGCTSLCWRRHGRVHLGHRLPYPAKPFG